MTPPRDEDLGALSETVKGSWHRFLDVYEPLRPELYRYYRYLTRSPWDVEDLVQDTLARAFVTLGALFRPPPNPRAWMFRVASNLWIDRMRRAREVLGVPPEQPAAAAPSVDRDAAAALLTALSPQERAAVVLKDVFGLTLEEGKRRAASPGRKPQGVCVLDEQCAKAGCVTYAERARMGPGARDPR